MPKVVPECFSVRYTWHGEKTKAIFLTRDRAEDYIAKHQLHDAVLSRCYREQDIEYAPVERACIVKQLDATTESQENDGTLDTDSVSNVQNVTQGG